MQGASSCRSRHHGHDLCNPLPASRCRGKRHECIAQLDHLRLALAHGVADEKLGQVVLGHAGLDEEGGLHADNGRAAFDGRARHSSHKSDRAAAIHERVPGAGDQAPKLWAASSKCGLSPKFDPQYTVMFMALSSTVDLICSEKVPSIAPLSFGSK